MMPIHRGTAALLLAIAACDPDSKNTKDGSSDSSNSSPADSLSDQQLSEQWLQKRKDCGTYYPSQDPANDTVRDGFDRCVARCFLEQDCDKLVEIWCEGGVPAGDPFLDCVSECPEEPKDGYKCKDGSRIPLRIVCDGSPHCSAGEDEQGCAPYVCEDGQEIIGTDIECNNRGECEDYSDEESEEDFFFCPLTCQLRDPSAVP